MTTTAIDTLLNAAHYDQSWHEWLVSALTKVDPDYLTSLVTNTDWLPGPANIFNAFSINRHKARYVLLGESPYPRRESANGYAFWDQSVANIWSDKGLSTAVNRATSLRNLLKMLLVTRGDLSAENTSQAAIARIDKTHMISTLSELFHHLLDQGFLLLNASPVLSAMPVKQEAKHWQPFVKHLLDQLACTQPECQLILFGKIADSLLKLGIPTSMIALRAEHPYNISFIQNPEVLQFFNKLTLLDRT